MKIFLTGSSGFIGSVVKDALREHDLVLYAKQPTPSLHELVVAMENTDVVVHLAGGGGMKECTAKPYDAIQNNILLTTHLVTAAKQSNVNQFIFASSIAVYSTHIPRENPLSEIMVPQPDEIYGLLKWCCEEIVRAVPYTILRFANVYGYGAGKNLHKGGFINNACLNLKKKSSLILHNPQLQMDFVHVSDVARAITFAINNPLAIGEVINIGSGRGVTLEEVANIMSRQVPINLSIEDKPTYASRWVDRTKARALLGWTPSITLEEGIDELMVK